MNSLLLVNGPNLNLLGYREPEIYGKTKLQDLEIHLRLKAEAAQAKLQTFQSNHEGAIIDRIHQAKFDQIQCILINPGAFTHTSIAIRDALSGCEIPFIEIHISQVFQRESFRHHSFISDIAWGRLVGMGLLGYDYALEAALTLCKQS